MEQAIQEHLAALALLGRQASGGYLRAGYSDAETAAMLYVQQAGALAGLTSRWDAVGNLILETPGDWPAWAEVASHLDTVPNGGNFDGAAGVVCGLEAIQTIRAAGRHQARGLRLRVWRCEESATFGIPHVGSRAAFGGLDGAVLQREFRGRSLWRAMEEQGVEPRLVELGCRTISEAEAEGIVAHLELHIEQGPVLERAGVPLGIVTGVRGATRLRVEVAGSWDHSGTTPTETRRDANLAVGWMVANLDRAFAEARRFGDLIQTVSLLNQPDPRLEPAALTKVAGFAHFSLDIRALDAEFRGRYVSQVLHCIREVAKEHRVAARVFPLGETAGVARFDAWLQRLLAESAAALGFVTLPLPSGAGHDAAIVAAQGVPTAMLFVPCRGGKSHCPEEEASLADLARGAAVLARTLEELTCA